MTSEDKIVLPPVPGPPRETPIGLLVGQVGRVVERAFDEALSAAGGTRPTWLVLLAIMSGSATTQSALAESVGISGPTLVHHLDRLETAGLVTRIVDPANRRIRTLQLTEAGRTAFFRMREAAMGFDAKLRAGLTEAELSALGSGLARLRTNAHTTQGAMT